MQVSAVVANEPFLTGDGNFLRAVQERGLLKVFRLAAAALLDKVTYTHGVLPLLDHVK